MNTTYRGRFRGMFDSQVADVLENALEMLDYGDEIFFAEIGFEADSRVTSINIVIGPGSVNEPIDLTGDDDDDDDVRPPFWNVIDEVENSNNLLNHHN